MKKPLFFGLLLLSACDCSERRTTHEVMYDATEQVSRQILQDLRNGGWSCNQDGFIRNGTGATIGERYSCTRCD